MKKVVVSSPLKVVISSDYRGIPFINVLMPNGKELPCVRKCSINSDFKDVSRLATVELFVDISTIEKYNPPKEQTPAEFLIEKGFIGIDAAKRFIKLQDKEIDLADLLSEYLLKVEIKN